MVFKRSIGRYAILFAAIGGMVGSGWLLGPFNTVKVAGPAAIISWPVAGVLMLFIAYTFITLTRTLPIAGGTVRFLQLSHGHFVGFTFSWIAWLAWISVTPIEVLAVLQYTATWIPSLMHTVNGSQELSLRGFECAVVLMVIMYLINIGGIKILSRANNLVVFFKLAIPVVTVFVLFFSRFHTQNFHGGGGFMPMGVKGILAALPTAGVIYALIGFNPAIQLAAEVKNPEKSIAFAIIGSILTCVVLYTVLQIVFIGALDPSDFAHGWAHLSYTGDSGPFAGIIIALGLAWYVKLLYIDAVVSPFGTAMIQAAATGRLTYGMAQNHYLPQFLTQLNPKKSPAIALAFNILIGFLFFLPFPSWQKMVGFLVSCLSIGYVVGPMSLVTLKRAMPELVSKYSVSKVQTMSLIAFYVCNLIIFWSGWGIIYKVMIAFAIGYVMLILYSIFSSAENKIKMDFQRGWWAIPYIIGLGVISYFSSYGGGTNVIHFGWDFVVMAVFTVVIFYLAQYLSGQPEAVADTKRKVNACIE